MLFNSFAFLLFLPLVVGVHHALPGRFRWAWLLAASYLFYAWWEPAYTLLIIASTLIDWTIGLRMPQATPKRRKLLLACSLLVNLGLLVSFKYYNLINGTFVEWAATFGVDWPIPESSLLLPVGISFYTFQTLAYAIDVYRGDLKPERHLGRFALYVAFWPQLVAGPIERAGRLLPQLTVWRPVDAEMFVSGLRRIVWGLFKKLVVADRVGPIANAIYGDPAAFDGWGVVIGTVCFGYQVWLDFSGYTDIAIGCARLLGVDLMENFNQPHLSTSIRDYWARWHISLSTWFRDYLYLPLGGSRVSKARHFVNLFVVFWLCGMWHGASWTFGMWGGANAVFLWVGARTRARREAFAERVGLTRVPRIRQTLQVLTTFVIAYSAYPFFRAESLSHWWEVVSRLPYGWGAALQPGAWEAFCLAVGPNVVWVTAALLLMPLTDVLQYLRRDARSRTWFASLPTPVRWCGDYALLFGVLVFGELSAQQFFYFQF